MTEPSGRPRVSPPVRRRDVLMFSLGVVLGCGRSREQPERASPTPSPAASPPAPPSDPLGSLDDIPAELRPAFDVGVHPPPPKLPIDGEPPQSFAQFLAERPPQLEPGRRTLAILPIGEYPRGFVVEYERVHLVRSPEPALLARFCEAWFGLPVRVLPAMTDERLEQMPARERDGRRQLDAEAMLTWLGTQLPADCSCVLALTLEDLYQIGAAWVFGLASVTDRVGVHSMLRYDPGFANADARPPNFEHMILTRALRVVVHETAHMFGLRHCVHFACVQNPTAGVADLDRLPLRLCPVCLRKLQHATGLDLGRRWLALAALADELELADDSRWYTQRATALGRPRRVER